jgi:hypothetical protein
MMDINNIKNKNDLAVFVRELSEEDISASWENKEIKSYLEAMSGWIEDMDGYYENKGEKQPTTPSWKTVAEILRAATVYE